MSWAAEKGHVAILLRLIAAGADSSAVDNVGCVIRLNCGSRIHTLASEYESSESIQNKRKSFYNEDFHVALYQHRVCLLRNLRI